MLCDVYRGVTKRNSRDGRHYEGMTMLCDVYRGVTKRNSRVGRHYDEIDDVV